MKKILIIVLLGFVLLGGAGLLISSRKGKAAPKSSHLKEAETAFSKKDYLKARSLYEKTMEESQDIDQLKQIQKKIEESNIKIIFSPLIEECSTKYIVNPKDVLIKIAGKFNTTVGLIMRANNLTSDIIKPRQELKVNTCEFSVVVDRSQNLLFLKRAGKIIKTYIVSTGKENSTPIGNFKIANKIEHPTWFKTGAVIPPDSPENILGSRWMGFDIRGYGIHGTTKPNDLGRQVTLGCVRMRNEDVEELFDLIPKGAEITIID